MAQRQARTAEAGAYTYGVEIECFLPAAEIERLGIRIGGYHRGVTLPEPFPTGWTAEHDGSLHTSRPGYVSLEIVSPILQGGAGISEVKTVCRILNDMNAHVNDSTGLHIHIGAGSVAHGAVETAEWVGRLLYQTAMHETALYASTGTHRREDGRSQYARSIKSQQAEADDLVKTRSEQKKREALRRVANYGGRYHSLNVTNLFSTKATVEFRYAAGTTDWRKIVGHIQTCLALAERATERGRMDWDAVASDRTYKNGGAGVKALNRFFYLTGWTLGRRQVGQPEVNLAGWVGDLEDLDEVKRELTRLARKYDGAG